MDDLRRALVALATKIEKDKGTPDESWRPDSEFAGFIRAILSEHPPEPAEGTGLRDVLAERKRQDVKWGEQNHDPITYLAILMEEVGELAQAALHQRFGGDSGKDRSAEVRTEAIHSAAVALAIVECLDRGKWTAPAPDGGMREAAQHALECLDRFDYFRDSGVKLVADALRSALRAQPPTFVEGCACWTDSDGDHHTEACTIHGKPPKEKRILIDGVDENFDEVGS